MISKRGCPAAFADVQIPGGVGSCVKGSKRCRSCRRGLHFKHRRSSAGKKRLLEEGSAVFERKSKTADFGTSPDLDSRHRKTGEWTMERNFLQGKLVPWTEPKGRR